MDSHIIILIAIIILIGGFGGLLNYLHNFDIEEPDYKKHSKYKYIFLGIGAAILVPAFLKMIASNLIENEEDFNKINYLIFAGFCLVAAIFSRRFINTVGEKILEAAKKAEKTSKETKKQMETTKVELSSTQERIEDVKLAVSLKNIKKDSFEKSGTDAIQSLIKLVDSYVSRTSIPDYAERLKLKAELGRKMGQIVVRHDLPKNDLLVQYPKEGMYLALAYAVELKPDEESLAILNSLSKICEQLYTKYVILVAYRTLASSGLISEEETVEIGSLIEKFRIRADRALIRNIDDTFNVLRFINPELY